jgi:Cu(I)/Ag(I) efflux system membrane protein CusA/SilA
MIYFNFRNIIEPVIVMIPIPFGLACGIWLVWVNDYNMSVAVCLKGLKRISI